MVIGIDALTGFIVGLPVGIIIGFMLWGHGAKKDTDRLEQIQVAGLWILVGYLLTPLIGFSDPDAVVVSLIVSIVIGEKAGVAIAKTIDLRKKK